MQTRAQRQREPKFLCIQKMRPSSDSIVFTALAATLVLSLNGAASEKTQERRFKKVFGVSAATCARLWNLCLPSLPSCALPIHLLWALYWLKQYSLEEVNAAFVSCDEKTFRKWCWIVVEELSNLDLVSHHL